VLSLLTRERPVGELERLWARQCRLEKALQLPACRELTDQPFENAMTSERAGDLLRKRSRERSVEDSRDLRSREHVVRCGLELVAPDSRGRSRREEGGAPGRSAQPRTLFVGRGHYTGSLGAKSTRWRPFSPAAVVLAAGARRHVAVTAGRP
jgi:hypothetical protein